MFVTIIKTINRTELNTKIVSVVLDVQALKL